jgi:antitoxin component of MazEF toxin-antitoxin module
MKTTFETTVKAIGNNTGIEVPEQNMTELGTSKKPAVSVNLSGYKYQSTVAVMAGKFMIPLSAAHRTAAKLKGGDAITVTLELDLEPRGVELPEDLAAALEASDVMAAFEKSAPSKRKEFVRQVMDAKTQETRERRIEKVVTQLKA